MGLRLTIQREVSDKLDATYFTAEDFDIEFGNTTDQALIKITFKHNKKYVFAVTDSDENPYSISMRPGDIYEEGFDQADDIQSVLDKIPNWANEIRNELKADRSIQEKIVPLHKLISELLGSQSKDEEFTVKEINSLQKKFKDLESRVVQLEKEKIITGRQLEEFKNGIEQVSDDIGFYPKRTWLKTAPNKLIKIVIAITRSQEGRDFIASNAKKLLGLE